MNWPYGPIRDVPEGRAATSRITAQAEAVASSADLARFLQALSEHFTAFKGPEWENATVDDYLESISAWLTDWQRSDGPAELRARETPWNMVARIFLAGMFYE